MKNIQQFITERSWREWAYRNQETTIHFKNNAAMCLYEMELSGQISDGLYENSTPYDHWMWISNATSVVDGYEGYEGPEHVKRYSLRGLVSHIGKNNGWEWTERLLWYACFGSIIDKSQSKELADQANALRSVIEDLGDAVMDGKFTTVDDLKNAAPDYAKKYYEKATLMTQENAEKFISALKKYDINKLKKDAASCGNSVNNHYNPNHPAAQDDEIATDKVVKTAEDKMDAWHEGTRKQNVKACSDDKLGMYYGICKEKGYTKEADILKKEMEDRGIFNK